MSAFARPLSRRFVAWPATCLALVGASVALWLAALAGQIDPEWLVWRHDGWRAAPWTLWSSPLLHVLGGHLAANGLALTALGVLGLALGATGRDAVALLLAWPLGTALLLAWPRVGAYYGLSAVVHAAAAILAGRALARPETQLLGCLLATGLALKLALERAWLTPVGFDGNWGFNVVYAAHLSGALAGAAAALLLAALSRRWRPSGAGRGGPGA